MWASGLSPRPPDGAKAQSLLTVTPEEDPMIWMADLPVHATEPPAIYIAAGSTSASAHAAHKLCVCSVMHVSANINPTGDATDYVREYMGLTSDFGFKPGGEGRTDVQVRILQAPKNGSLERTYPDLISAISPRLKPLFRRGDSEPLACHRRAYAGAQAPRRSMLRKPIACKRNISPRREKDPKRAWLRYGTNQVPR
jgi:hypothetical protein